MGVLGPLVCLTRVDCSDSPLVDMLGLQYKSVNFGAGKSPGESGVVRGQVMRGVYRGASLIRNLNHPRTTIGPRHSSTEGS